MSRGGGLRSRHSVRLVAGLAVVLVSVALGATTTPPAVSVIAHRGASWYAPEHTYAAWDLALEMGADYLEQDLQMTADGVLVVMHDERLDRTARGPQPACSGPVIDHTLAQLCQCEVGSWFNEQHPDRVRADFVGLQIPTLQDVLSRYAGRARFYIETKNPEAAPGMEQALIRLLQEHDLLPGQSGAGAVIVQSFSPASLRRLHALEPELPLVQLAPARESSTGIRELLDEVARYASGIGPEQDDVDAALVGAAHERGLLVHPYTIDRPSDMDRLLALGVDGMFTNRPDVLRQHLQEY